MWRHIKQGEGMDSRLEGIRDWDDRAKVARYSVEELACGTGISRRQLDRHFQTESRLSAHQWMELVRMKMARGLLKSGISVKAAAFEVGYSNASNFAHAFRRVHGFSPSQSRGFHRPTR